MKFEKMNDQQIRCTLTKEDLSARKIKISELAYGTEKARSLFNDILTLAQEELGFEVEDMPLMVEAIPVSSDSLVLMVTKVEDPEELDTRFAQFTPSLLSDSDESFIDENNDMPFGKSTDVDELMKLFKQIATLSNANDANGEAVPTGDTPFTNRIPTDLNLVRIFSFSDMNAVINMSKSVAGECISKNSLYKDLNTGRYQLLVEQSPLDLITYNRICNIISEYGESERSMCAADAYLEEHCELIVKDEAVKQLSAL